MSEAIMAYRYVAASSEFREMERVRSKARHDEAQAIFNAERRGEERANASLQGVIAEKDAALANKDALIAKLQAQLNNQQ